ncbi:MAG TPA: HAMP domain-containing sensor histidine kinase [Vicinamibacterales bacterium]|nr:HAMP domain-containing sensor histidine kinase [Vicinamibacterales bacterium]
MPNGTVDPRWPRLLSLTVHEFRTPMTVVAGYLRMLLKDRAGPITDQQRRLLEEAEKSCARLSALLAEVSDLANLEAGTGTFNKSTVDLRPLMTEAIGALPPTPDRDLSVELAEGGGGSAIVGDPTRLRTAFASIFNALRRELVTSSRLLVREETRNIDGRAHAWIAIADDERLDQVAAANPGALTTFDEWRGGSGLSLAVARRIINAHGGQIWSPGDDVRAAAVIALPSA